MHDESTVREYRIQMRESRVKDREYRESARVQSRECQELETKMAGLKNGAQADALETSKGLATLAKAMSQKSAELDQMATIDL